MHDHETNEIPKLTLAEKLNMLQIDETTISRYKSAKDTLGSKLYKDAEKTEKELGTVIKKELVRVELDKGEYTVHGVKLALSFQERSSVNDEELISILEKNNLNDAIIIQRTPDVAKVAEYIKSGQLTDEQFQQCVIVNKIPVLKLGKVKSPFPFPNEIKTDVTCDIVTPNAPALNNGGDPNCGNGNMYLNTGLASTPNINVDINVNTAEQIAQSIAETVLNKTIKRKGMF